MLCVLSTFKSDGGITVMGVRQREDGVLSSQK